MRSLSHIGLSLALLVAPALCCCNLRWMAAASAHTSCPTCTQPTPEPAKSACCQQSCCHQTEPQPAPVPTPQKAPCPSCCCVTDRPVAAHTEAKPEIPSPEFTGEMLAPTALVPVGLPVHADLAAGLDPPERAGVDARYAALFDRHVLRC